MVFEMETSANLLLDATWSLTLERSRKDWKVALKKRGSREPDSRPSISHLRESFNLLVTYVTISKCFRRLRQENGT